MLDEIKMPYAEDPLQNQFSFEQLWVKVEEKEKRRLRVNET